MKSDQRQHHEIIGDAHYTARRHDWTPIIYTEPVQRRQADHAKLARPKGSKTRDWILAALADKPDGLTGAEIKFGSGIAKGAFDAMFSMLMEKKTIEICGNRRSPTGARTQRIYRLCR